MDHSEVQPPSRELSRGDFSLVRLSLMIAIVLLVAAAAYWKGRASIPPPGDDANLRIFGLDTPTENKLDSQYVDANGDLLADAPAEPANWIDPETLTFSYLANDQSRYAEIWSTFVDHLSKSTGKPVEYLAPTSPNEQLEMVREGRLHVTGINAGNVPMAVNRCGFVPMVTLGTEGAVQTYTMQIIVRPDSSFDSVEGLRGRTLTLTNPGSNSGWKAPLMLLMRDYDLHPVRDYMVDCSDSHRASIQGIVDGQYEVASVASDEVDLMKGRDELDDAQLKVVYESSPFTQNSLGTIHNLKPELAGKIREAFLSFDWTGTALQQEFANMGVSQFVVLNYKDEFGLIREIDDAVGRRHATK